MSGQVAYRRDDYAEALRLWGQLADQGNARAQFSLGKMYYIGQGVLRDNAKADAWYRKAADQGFDYAQFDLGVAYEDGGLGVPQNYALAHMWFNLASSPATNTDLRQMAVESRDKVAAIAYARANRRGAADGARVEAHEGRPTPMIRLTFTAAAYEAIAATLPLLRHRWKPSGLIPKHRPGKRDKPPYREEAANEHKERKAKDAPMLRT